jgi:hypothetical protein
MNVLAPIVAVLACRMFSLHGAVIVALVTLAIAPVGALFSQAMLPLVTPGHADPEGHREIRRERREAAREILRADSPWEGDALAASCQILPCGL